MLITLISFVIVYELTMVFFSIRISKTPLKSVMIE